MISKETKIGTMIWNKQFGFGEIIKTSDTEPDYFSILFKDGSKISIHRRKLMEVEE